MNRIAFEKGEIVDGVAVISGPRADHILNVLHGETGDRLKTCELDGYTGTGEITAIEGSQVILRLVHDKPSLQPWCDLILAPPRPRVMKRLLPQLAAMGVGGIYLVGAKKVEKDFWGATLLKEENYRPLLVDGLMQSGTSIVPRLEMRRNFRRFVCDELDSAFPGSSGRRIVAHPYAKGLSGSLPEAKPCAGTAGGGRILLAVGPEGGWTDEEVELLELRGFARYSLGARILRTDTATIALLARLGEIYDTVEQAS